jgi:hypothetical protein
LLRLFKALPCADGFLNFQCSQPSDSGSKLRALHTLTRSSSLCLSGAVVTGAFDLRRQARWRRLALAPLPEL